MQLLNPRFFCPVQILSQVFRGKFIEYLRRAKHQGKLHLQESMAYLQQEQAFEEFISTACQKPWVVYAKPPFQGPLAVIRYLSRYTHRVAISNKRLLSLKQKSVTFSYRDSRSQTRKNTTLSAVEFIRRFLLHTLPRGFVRIRHCGFLAASKKEKALAIFHHARLRPSDTTETSSKAKNSHCPHCGSTRLITTLVTLPPLTQHFDSS